MSMRAEGIRTSSFSYAFLNSGAEKGDKSNLCIAPEGPFRQIGLIPFFSSDNSGRDGSVVQKSRQPDLLILKLIEKLGSDDPITRRNAAGALRLQGSRARAAIPAISVLLGDQDPRVRTEAERAIDRLRRGAA
jgi:hypothetical protein